jgi:hypothetical protein
MYCITVQQPIAVAAGLRRGSTAAGLLGMPVRILRGGGRGMDVCLLSYALSEVSAPGRSLVQRSPTDCRVPECDQVTHSGGLRPLVRSNHAWDTLNSLLNKSTKESHAWETCSLSAGQEHLHISRNFNLTQLDMRTSNITHSGLQCWSETVPCLQQLRTRTKVRERFVGHTSLTVAAASAYIV